MLDRRLSVSVVVVTYNQEKYVKKTIESILSQLTDFDFEIVVADDASRDGTQDKLKELKEKFPNKINLILRRENLGPTRNAYDALMTAKGDFIASLEGDDFWCRTDFLQRGKDFLEANPQYIGVADKCKIVGEDGEGRKVKTGFWSFDKREFELSDFTQWKMPGHLSAVIYRNIFRLFPDDYDVYYRLHSFIGDRTLLMFLTARGKIYCSDEVSLAYRLIEDISAGNWMSKYKAKNRRPEEFRLICDLEKILTEHFSLPISMEPLKRSKLAAAALVALQRPSFDNIRAFGKIFCLSGGLFSSMEITLLAVIQKLYWICRGEPGHRVKV